MEENSRFDFCPKCGALAKDGVCQSCGYQNPAYTVPVQEQAAFVSGNGLSVSADGNRSGTEEQLQSAQTAQFQPGNPPQGQQPLQDQAYYGQNQGYYGSQGYYNPQGYGGAQGYYGQPGGQPQPADQQMNQQMNQAAGQQMNPQMNQPAGQQMNPQINQAAGQQINPQMNQTAAQGYYYNPQSAQGYYYAPQTGQPYGGYASPVPLPAAENKTKKGTVALLIVLGVVLLAVLILILVGLYRVFGGNDQEESDWTREQEEEWDDPQDEDFTENWLNEEQDDAQENGTEGQQESGTYEYTYEHDSFDSTQENWDEPGQDESIPYYSGPYNALRDDLSYQENFVTETFYAKESNAILIEADYPQLSGDIPNVDGINRHLRQEYEFYQETFEQKFMPLLSGPDDYYLCVEDCYVTYMDEEILSIVCKETIYMCLNEEPLSILHFNCYNLDVKTGELIENTELLNVDEAFVATLREREREENTDIVLDMYTDEEILEMLRDRDTLVLFYTPMGIEVGFNLDQRVIYFMYEDYEQYLNEGAL